MKRCPLLHFALLLTLVPDVGAQDFDPALVHARFGTADVELTTLRVPEVATELLEIPFQFGNELFVARLSRHSLRSSTAPVRAWLGKNDWLDVDAGPVATYRGTLSGRPGATVTASLTQEGLRLSVFESESRTLAVRPLALAEPDCDRALHVVFGDPHAHPELGACSPIFTAASISSTVPTALPGGLPGGTTQATPTSRPDRIYMPADCRRICEIAFDADFEYYQLKGADVQSVIAAIEGHMNEVDFFYGRDLNVSFILSGFVVRTAAFYAPTSGGNLLGLFRDEWNANQGAIQRDCAHLMTNKPGAIIEFGGLAWVGALCNGASYAWSRDSAGIIGHEIGHNFGSSHCHDTSPCNNMCGACLFIAPNTRSIKQNYMAGAGCLDVAPPGTTPFPPHTTPDSLTVKKSTLLEGSLSLNVLDNDFDGNCQTISIGSVDATSARGAALGFSGPEVTYDPPSDLFVGTDTFQYDTQDGSGLSTAGDVTIEVEPLNRIARWGFDEIAGNTVAGDGGLDGTTTDTDWTTGRFANGLLFDADTDITTLPGIPLATNEMSLSCWVKRDGHQNFFAGIFFNRSGSTDVGLHFGFANELRYTWNDHPGTTMWDSQLIPPDGVWCLVTLTIEPDRATLYMYDGTTLSSAVNVFPHDDQDFAGDSVVGHDPGAIQRFFHGTIDELAIHDHALTAEHVTALTEVGARTELPTPIDGGNLIVSGQTLAASTVAGATSYDIYFGTSYAAVNDATNASTSFQGNFPTPDFTPPQLILGAGYYWRIDGVNGQVTGKGHVWGVEHPLRMRWRLDETSGTAAAEQFGPFWGTYSGSPLLGEPGATAQTGTSVFLDGSNDHVEIPALQLDSDRVTITSWIRRSGDQSSWAGVAFTRSGSSTAGLNIGTANELRYHWNGGNWGWDSGLVPPDDTWVFAALVIEPSRATIYMGDGGALVSSVNTTGHSAEEFDGVLRIGQDQLSGGRRFHGWIDDVRIYRAALSEEEIQLVYDSVQ